MKKRAKHSACLERAKLKMFEVTETIQQHLVWGRGGEWLISFPMAQRADAFFREHWLRKSGRLCWLLRCWVAEYNCRILQISTDEILYDFVFLGTMIGNNPPSLPEWSFPWKACGYILLYWNPGCLGLPCLSVLLGSPFPLRSKQRAPSPSHLPQSRAPLANPPGCFCFYLHYSLLL